MDKSKLQSLISQLSDIDFDHFDGDVASRRQLLTTTRALVKHLELPMETMWEMSHNHPVM